MSSLGLACASPVLQLACHSLAGLAEYGMDFFFRPGTGLLGLPELHLAWHLVVGPA